MRPSITLSANTSGRRNFIDSLQELTRQQILVGIPQTDAQKRQAQVAQLIGKAHGKKRKANLRKAAGLLINNAQLCFVHTFGSPLRGIPARPVIEAAISDPENKKLIVAELKLAADAAFRGNKELTDRQIELAGQMAENLVKGWFTNPRNNWAPNAPSTIRQKGSSKPLIDTGALRQAMTHVIVSK